MINPIKAYYRAIMWCVDTADCGGPNSGAAQGKAAIGVVLVAVPILVIGFVAHFAFGWNPK